MSGGQAKHDEERWLTTGEMARLSKTTLRTVRFYEAEGLISSRVREDGSHRKFRYAELEKLQIISDLRDAGLSLGEIKDLVAVKSGCPTAARAAVQMSETLSGRLQDVERRIEALDRVRAELLQFRDMLQTCAVCTHPEFPQRCK